MHECPTCFQHCSCRGDIDDMIFSRPPRGGCFHPECENDDDWDEDEFYTTAPAIHHTEETAK